MSLWVSGTFGPLITVGFIGLLAAGWLAEGTRWQLNERLGTILIVLSLPLFYLGWRLRLFAFADYGALVSGILARLILTISAIKTLQSKSDRDWIFLYLMSFFEVLLAAALSISALYLATFIIFLVVMACAVLALEIRKGARSLHNLSRSATPANLEAGFPRFSSRLPSTAIVLVLFVGAAALPMFFLLPRVGGAGMGGGMNNVSTSSGFSDSVRLGGIGRIQQNNEVVMRVRLEKGDTVTGPLYWRGTALDTFDNLSWSKRQTNSRQPFIRGERDLIQVDYVAGRDNLTVQTVYLEPLDTPVLFALARPVAFQGSLPMVFKDAYGSISTPRNQERITYKVLSDGSQPPIERLRADKQAYSEQSRNYLQLPDQFDERITALAGRVTSKAQNRYDKAKAVEQYLQNNLGYTLELKAKGSEPLSDFLFNVREGHCEYFASAMAIMLRTQGIATRIVNGFQQGEYNETADAFIVRQRNAHSWVEVYFPGENAWIRFDPTPYGGQPVSFASGGISGRFDQYLEALEMYWVQYFVAFDNQEQKSLFRTVRNGFVDYQARTSGLLKHYENKLADWWSDFRGDRGTATSMAAAVRGLAYTVAIVLIILMLVWISRKIKGLALWRRILLWLSRRDRKGSVEFYERMQRVLASKGYVRQPHQTPLEFAYALELPQAVKITERYNSVRFGEQSLTAAESGEIQGWLESLAERKDIQSEEDPI